MFVGFNFGREFNLPISTKTKKRLSRFFVDFDFHEDERIIWKSCQ